MLKIIPCFLDKNNSLSENGETLGLLVYSNGYDCLWEKRETNSVDTIVIHYISAIEYSPQKAFNINNVLRIFPKYGVSSHYLIDREGLVYQLVPEEMKAWHAGLSCMPPPDGRVGVNSFSIGIELIATETSGFTANQYCQLSMLISSILERWPVKKILGHEDISGLDAVESGIRTVAKRDPGPLFCWNLIKKV